MSDFPDRPSTDGALAATHGAVEGAAAGGDDAALRPSPGRHAPGPVGFERGLTRSRFESRRVRELLAVTSLAVAQPVLGIFGDDPATLVALGAGAIEVITFALVVCFGPALAAWGVTALAGQGRPRFVAHLGVLGLFGGVMASQVIRDATSLGRWATVIAALVGACVVAALATRSVVREILRLLSAVVVLFGGLFLLGPAGDVAFARGGASAAVGAPAEVDLVMIVLDELPTTSLLDGAGNIDADLFPNFARLADRSTWYRNHTTVAPFTAVAVPSLLTGQLPDDPSAAPTLASYPDNLLGWVADTGSVNAEETITRLCPDTCIAGAERGQPRHVVLRRLLGDAIDVWVDRSTPDRAAAEQVEFVVEGFPTDEAAVDRLAEWADEVPVDRSGPRVDFIHVLAPHQPFVRNADGTSYEGHEPPRGSEFFIWSPGHATEVGRLRHQLQLRATDAALGRVLDALESSGRLDRSALAVVADHGIAFEGDQPLRGVSAANAEHTLWVPFFLSAPGQEEGRIVDVPARSVDVAPTIAGVFGVELPWETDGVDLATVEDALPPEQSQDGELAAEGNRELVRSLDWRFNEGLEPDDQGYVSIDGDSAFAELLEARPTGGAVGEPFRQFRIGPRPELLGERMSDVDMAPAQQWPLLWDHPTVPELESDGGATQTYVSVRVEGLPEGDLAVVVDGRVGAILPWVTSPFGISDAWGILPTELVPEGTSEVELFIVSGPSGRPEFAPLDATPLELGD